MIYLLLAPGFEEAEALVPADLLRRAKLEVALVSLDGENVAGSHGVAVVPDLALSQVDLDRAEMIVLPGGGLGFRNLGKDPRVEELVREAVKRELWVAAICASPTLLARWGCLEGKEAVCYPGMEDGLAGARSRPERSVVVDGKIITGRAAGSAFDFGLALVEALAGKERAGEVRRAVVY